MGSGVEVSAPARRNLITIDAIANPPAGGGTPGVFVTFWPQKVNPR